jgi:hypothetical protein
MNRAVQPCAYRLLRRSRTRSARLRSRSAASRTFSIIAEQSSCSRHTTEPLEPRWGAQPNEGPQSSTRIREGALTREQLRGQSDRQSDIACGR